MTNEQRKAIKIIDKMIKSYIEADECGLSNNDFKDEIWAMQTALSLLKEQEIYIEKSNNITEEMNGDITTLIYELKQKDKQIDLMADYIAMYDLDIEENICIKPNRMVECDKMALGECEDCIKQYFERKVKDVE